MSANDRSPDALTGAGNERQRIMKKTNETNETVVQRMQSPEDLAPCSRESSIVALLVDQYIRFVRRSGQMSVEQEEQLRARLTGIPTPRVIGFSR